MEGYSVIIPHREAAEPVARFVEETAIALAPRKLPVEFVIIDDHSSRDIILRLRRLLPQDRSIRLVQLTGCSGVGAALAAGLAASTYETLIAVDPSGGCSAADVMKLLARLPRYDLVIGRGRALARQGSWQSLRPWLFSLLARAVVLDPTQLCWAARREAIPAEALARGATRFLAVVVSRRGYRVGTVHLVSTDHEPGTLQQTSAHVCDLLATWWLAGREIRGGFVDFDPAKTVDIRIDQAHELIRPASASALTLRDVQTSKQR